MVFLFHFLVILFVELAGTGDFVSIYRGDDLIVVSGCFYHFQSGMMVFLAFELVPIRYCYQMAVKIETSGSLILDLR